MSKPLQIRGGYVARKPSIDVPVTEPARILGYVAKKKPTIPATQTATLPSHGDRQLDLFEALLRVNAPADVMEEVIMRSRCPLRLRHAIIVQLSKSGAVTVEKAKLVSSMALKLSREWSSITNVSDPLNITDRQIELFLAMVLCHACADSMEEVISRSGAALLQRHDLILELSKSRILTVEKQKLVRSMALKLSNEWAAETKAIGEDSKTVCDTKDCAKTGHEKTAEDSKTVKTAQVKLEGLAHSTTESERAASCDKMPDVKLADAQPNDQQHMAQQIELNRMAFEQDMLEYLFATESGAIVPPRSYRGINFGQLKNKWIVYAKEKFCGAADEREEALHAFADVACYVVQLAPDGLSGLANTAGCAVPSKK